MTAFARALSPALLIALVAACSTPSNRPVDEGARPMPPAPKVVEPDTVEREAGPNAVSEAGPRATDSDVASSEDPMSTDPASTDPASTGPATTAAADSDGSTTAEAPTNAGTRVGDEVDDVAVSWPRSVDATADAIVANVAGREIPMTELVSKWILRDPNGVRALLDDLVLSRIVVLEAAELGLQPPISEVEQTVRQRLAALEREAKAAGAPDLETFIREVFGFEPDVFLRNFEQEAAIDRLAPRCVRAWMLSSDRREVRAIMVPDQAGVDQVQARLAKGDAFADVARELSTDVSKDDGGRLTPLVRGESTLARTAFATEVGQVAGPVREGPSFLFVLVEAAPARVTGTWTDVSGAVDASLAERDIEDPEFWQWKEAMSRRYDVDIQPFLQLLR